MDGTTAMRLHKGLAGAVAGLVLVMAVLAGQGTYGGLSIEIHGYVGNLLFVLVVANLAVSMLARVSRATMSAAAALALLAFAQTGLGYVGRETLEAAAWHIPNGVLIMGVSTYHYLDLRTRWAARRPDPAQA